MEHRRVKQSCNHQRNSKGTVFIWLTREMHIVCWVLNCVRVVLNTRKVNHLFGSSLNAAVFARDIFAVPMISSSTCQAEIRITLPHSQIARTLLRVALCFTTAPRKPILAFKENKTKMLKLLFYILYTCKQPT